MTRISYTYDTDLTDYAGGYLKPKLGWFSRDAARCVATEAREFDGNNMISRATGSQWQSERLLMSAGGTYIIERDNADGRFGNTVGLTYHYLTPTDAEEWLRKQDLHEVADVEFAPVEERGPGRPAIGTEIKVTIPDADLAALDAIGPSRSAAVREAVAVFVASR